MSELGEENQFGESSNIGGILLDKRWNLSRTFLQVLVLEFWHRFEIARLISYKPIWR
jgi:hypothetical protein